MLRPGVQFDRYTIVRRIGRGGMAAVYEGLHAELKKRVAIKLLLPPHSENPDLRARFVREGRAASRIRHPHVVDIYDVGVHDEITFLVMEYLEGEDLMCLLRREPVLPISQVADIILPVIAAISAAHKEGVIHRDLKPANIFLSRGAYGDVVPKVLDFGISKLAGDHVNEAITQAGEVLGTPFYMSPEQATGKRLVDEKSDQYSIGVILYQCLTGKRPFEADSMYSILHNIVQGRFAPPRSVNPSLPASVEAIILRAMKRAPDLRFASIMDLGAALLPSSSARTKTMLSGVFGPPKSIDVLPTELGDASYPSIPLDETDPSLPPFPDWINSDGLTEQKPLPIEPTRSNMPAPSPLVEPEIGALPLEATASSSQPVERAPKSPVIGARRPLLLAGIALALIASGSWLMVWHYKRRAAEMARESSSRRIDVVPTTKPSPETEPAEIPPLPAEVAKPEPSTLKETPAEVAKPEPSTPKEAPATTPSEPAKKAQPPPRLDVSPPDDAHRPQKRAAPVRAAPQQKRISHPVLRGTNGAPVID
jgi:serine/threonine-protein kinase